jgi:hypothetical protein
MACVTEREYTELKGNPLFSLLYKDYTHELICAHEYASRSGNDSVA